MAKALSSNYLGGKVENENRVNFLFVMSFPSFVIFLKAFYIDLCLNFKALQILIEMLF